MTHTQQQQRHQFTLTAIQDAPNQAIEPIIKLVLDSVTSRHTKRAYSRALRDFLEWFQAQGQPFNKATVNAYKGELVERGLGAANVNQRLAAIKKLAREAADNGFFSEQLAVGIGRVRGVPEQGRKLGNWLTAEDVQALVNTPNVTTNKGKRDRAILAVMVGCGLRRSELVTITWEQIRKRQGRWLILDIRGKGGRVF